MPKYLITYRTPTGRTRETTATADTLSDAIENCVAETGCNFADVQRATNAAEPTDDAPDDFAAHVAAIRAESPNLTIGEARFSAWQEGPDELARRKAHQLTADEMDILARLPGIAVATGGKATLEATATGWRMSGPSGTHTLEAAATDLERLRAHWTGFQTHPANR